MHPSSLPVVFMSLALLACGQIAEETPSASTPGAASAPSPSGTTGAPSGTPASPGTASTSDGTLPTPRQPTPAVCTGASTTPRAYGTANELAVAIQGLWARCNAPSLAVLCPSQDSIVLLGSLDAPQDSTSRAVTCGKLTSHGDGLIADPSASFTYAVLELGSGRFSLHVWNASTDRTFDIDHYGDSTIYDEALAISTAGASEAARRTAFTTY
jgi:hypothetical protein